MDQTIYKPIEEILNEFDEPRKIIDSYTLISNNLQLFTSPEEKLRPEYTFELFALEVIEYDNTKNPWGDKLYFGPLFRHIQQDKCCERPDGTKVTNDSVSYWENRMNTVKNPMLKARYAGLVWDYAASYGIRKDSNLLIEYCNALCDISEYSLTGAFWISQRYLRRAFELGRNNEQIINRVKHEYNQLSISTGDDKPGIWGVWYKLVLENSSLFEEIEITNILKDANNRLDRIVEKAKSKEEGVNADTVKQLAMILARYYFLTKNFQERDRVLSNVETAYRNDFPQFSAAQKFYFVQDLQSLYNNFGNHLKDEAFIVEIQTLSREMLLEMEPIECSISIPNELWKNVQIHMATGEEEYQRAIFIYEFIPKKDILLNCVKKQAIQYPFKFMMQNQFISNGYPLSVVGGIEQDEEGQLIKYAAETDSIAESVPL